MPVREHVVSYRNGAQIMVAGLALREMGYCLGARVVITDPTGNPANEPWDFVVPNDEYSTIVCRTPRPPAWIQPGVCIRLDVQAPLGERELNDVHCDDSIRARVDCVPALPKPTTQETVLTLPRVDLPPRAIYAVDVGSPNGGLAWARLAPHVGNGPFGSTDYNAFLRQLIDDLASGIPVALGFEAPLFLPVAASIADLTRARLGEPGPWSFGAGAYVTTVAIPLMALTLRHIQVGSKVPLRVSLDPCQWLATGASYRNLLIWEAFVWGDGHARGPNIAGLRADIQDSATAVRAFVEWEASDPRPPSDVTDSDPISTVGAARLWAGLDDDLELLHQQALVLRPARPMGADVVAFVEKT